MTVELPGRAPTTDGELARQFHERIRRLENPRSVRVGPWVIATDPITGDLKASRPGQTLMLGGDQPVEVVEQSLSLSKFVTKDDLDAALDGIEAGGGGDNDSVWAQLYEKLTGILSPTNALNALANFFRLELGAPITSSRLPLLPLSHIRPISPNLLTDGSFDYEETLSGFPDWDWDDTVGRNKPGSAYTVADGTTHTIHSNSIEVGPDDRLNVEVYARWAGLVASGAAIKLDISCYRDDGSPVFSGPITLDSLTVSGTASGWTKLSVTNWDVPDEARHVVVELTVTSGATAGVVHFDDAGCFKIGTMPQSYISGLVEGLNALWQGIQARIDDFLDLLDVFGGFNVGDHIGQLTDVVTRLQHLNPLNGLFDASKLGNIANIPMIAQERISGLVTALNEAGQGIRDAIVQALGGSGTGHSNTDVLNALMNIPASVVNTAIAGASNIENALQQAIDSVIAGAGDLIGSGFGFADMIAQLTGLRRATAGTAAAVVNLQSQVANLDPAANSEVVDFGEFANSASPPSMFTKVSDTGSGSIILTNGVLAWNSADAAGREFYLYNGGPLQTDLFEVQVVLPSVPSHGIFGLDSTNYVYLIGRSDATGNNMVVARLGWDEVRVYSRNSGTMTQIGPTISADDILTSGSSVSFKGGTIADPRYFTLSINGDKVYEYSDEAPITVIGSSNRFCGLGLEKGNNYATGRISTWAMLDGGSSAGSGVVAGYTNAGLTNLILWKGTQAQYDALPTKSPNGIYVVEG
ncbi:minor tail protein [Mycobacterium phage Manad]|uniref:Minor tail protein n=1 Tax=Mycobacterium phage Manad TaxID=1486403 RepID=A0A059VGJ0_9CAUD|nr:minor tail protein [Mycobacterium phage Manad]AHZ95290.1 minor tail protein [Mycobacterium phage Manad]